MNNSQTINKKITGKFFNKVTKKKIAAVASRKFFFSGSRPNFLANVPFSGSKAAGLARKNNSFIPRVKQKTSNWKLKSFPHSGLFYTLKFQNAYKAFDYRAWVLFQQQQKNFFRKFKTKFLQRLTGRVFNKKSKIIVKTRKHANSVFSKFWFSRNDFYPRSKLFYFKKIRFTLSHSQKLLKKTQYTSIYKHKRAYYVKNFVNYSKIIKISKKTKNKFFWKISKNKLLTFRTNSKKKKYHSASFLLLANKNRDLVNSSTVADKVVTPMSTASRATFLLSKASKAKLRTKNLTKTKRSAAELFRNAKLFFSNDRILPKYNFVITLTTTNSNMYVNVANSFGETIFYHTMRRVGFQTGGSSKRSSKVAVERLGIFIGKKLRKKYFFNKKFLVIFRGITWRKRFILKYIRFGAKRKIKLVGFVERSALPHNGCKLKKRKHKRRSFLKLSRIKKKLRIRTIKRVFKNAFSKKPVFFKKNHLKFLSLLEIKKAASLKFLKLFKHQAYAKFSYEREVVSKLKDLRLNRSLPNKKTRISKKQKLAFRLLRRSSRHEIFKKIKF